MKNAELWKLIARGNAHDHVANLGEMIIASPIIVDTRPRVESPDFMTLLGLPIALPFPATWIECPHPNTVDEGGNETHVGALVGLASHEDFPREPESNAWASKHPEDRELLIGCFMGSPKNGAVMLGSARIHLREHRYPRLDDDMFFVNPFDYGKPEKREAIREMTNDIVFLTLDTLVFLSCSNVGIEPRDVAAVSRLGVKRHGGVPTPGFRYHVLTVRPAGSKPGTPGVEVGNMPRHVCRGHFAEYGPEFGKGLLFGKHAGRFFIPPHVRGNEKNGIVEKDYEVGL